MATSMFAPRRAEHRDLSAIIDYRNYSGLWDGRYEQQWLKPRLQALGYEHVRFFGGNLCGYDGSFRQRVCELKRRGTPVEYFVYG